MYLRHFTLLSLIVILTVNHVGLTQNARIYEEELTMDIYGFLILTLPPSPEGFSPTLNLMDLRPPVNRNPGQW